MDLRTPEQKVNLITKWSEWFYANTESFQGDLGMQLAYLYAAIAKDHQVEILVGTPLYNLIYGVIDEKDDLWSYITVVMADDNEADAADFEVGDVIMDAIEEAKGD